MFEIENRPYDFLGFMQPAHIVKLWKLWPSGSIPSFLIMAIPILQPLYSFLIMARLTKELRKMKI